MARRGENIHKRKDGRWEARYIMNYSLDGKAKYKSVYGATYTEVKEKLKQQQNLPKQRPAGSVFTYGQLCEEWLENTRMQIKASTYAKYYDLVHRHILPQLSSCRLSFFTVELVNQFAREKYESGRLDGKGGLSAKTIHDLTSIIIQIIRYGERSKKFSGFDYEGLILPKIPDRELPVLRKEDQSKLEAYIRQHSNLETFGVFLVLYTGLRIGELCALTWRDIDTQQGILHIHNTLQRIKNTDPGSPFKTRIIIDQPKSKKSIRDIPIPEDLLKQLKKLESKYPSHAFFLTGKVKKSMEPRVYEKKFKRFLQEANIEPINFHALRHTFATRADEKNFDIKCLSEVLGHASVKFTLERYVHTSAELKKEGMEKLTACR